MTVKTGDKWFAPLWRYPLCFVDHRIPFIGPDGKPARSNTQSSVIAYLGSNVEAFAVEFAAFGHIVLPSGTVGLALEHGSEETP